jgi:hypothetical protein
MSDEMSLSALHERVFRGLLLSADIAAREERGELPRADPPIRSRLLGRFTDFFPAELVDRAEKMAYVYGLIYCFENALRDLTAQRLEERRGASWWDSVPDKVKKYVKDRQKEAEENKWHESGVDANIDYTLFGHIAAIFRTLWPDFDDLFPSQPWIVQRLEELERSRNVVMHGNVLPASEVDRIERYLTDWLRQVP